MKKSEKAVLREILIDHGTVLYDQRESEIEELRDTSIESRGYDEIVRYSRENLAEIEKKQNVINGILKGTIKLN